MRRSFSISPYGKAVSDVSPGFGQVIDFFGDLVKVAIVVAIFAMMLICIVLAIRAILIILGYRKMFKRLGISELKAFIPLYNFSVVGGLVGKSEVAIIANATCVASILNSVVKNSMGGRADEYNIVFSIIGMTLILANLISSIIVWNRLYEIFELETWKAILACILGIPFPGISIFILCSIVSKRLDSWGIPPVLQQKLIKS